MNNINGTETMITHMQDDMYIVFRDSGRGCIRNMSIEVAIRYIRRYKLRLMSNSFWRDLVNANLMDNL